MDGRSKYVSLALKKFCKKEGVVMEFISSYTPEQNSIIERSWHIFDTLKNAILADSKLPKEF